jgi:hypothetical protein
MRRGAFMWTKTLLASYRSSPFEYQQYRYQIRGIKIIFIEEAENRRIECEAPIGKTVLDVALDNDVDIEGYLSVSYSIVFYFQHVLLIILGACGGELACSTCHVNTVLDVALI